MVHFCFIFSGTSDMNNRDCDFSNKWKLLGQKCPTWRFASRDLAASFSRPLLLIVSSSLLSKRLPIIKQTLVFTSGALNTNPLKLTTLIGTILEENLHVTLPPSPRPLRHTCAGLVWFDFLLFCGPPSLSTQLRASTICQSQYVNGPSRWVPFKTNTLD